ncbi:MAG: hypothetical protein ACHQ01_09625 [Candidatus Limnocylindrales bacterium]
MSDRRYGPGHAAAVTEMSRGLKREELLLRLEYRGWPSCDLREMGASGNLARHGVIGPGKEAWEQFCNWTTSREMNLVLVQLVHNPALFKGGKVAKA